MKSKNLSNILKSSGFKDIKLDSIIESRHILKRSGGNFRQYLFSFYDQNYKDYSLIPDLSIGSVIKFIQTKGKNKTKWSYSGEAYRKENKSNKGIMERIFFICLVITDLYFFLNLND